MSNSDTVKDKLVVEINYTLTDDTGNTLDSSKDNGPLAYIHGMNNIIPGLENELTGKKVGDKLSVKVAAKEGYGERREDMVQTVSKADFETPDELEIGMQFQVQTEDGHGLIATVIKMEGDTIVLDGNHPLAGMNLNFDVEVVGIREATQQELSHGHVHHGGHDH